MNFKFVVYMVHKNGEVYLVPTTCTVGEFSHFFRPNQLEYTASVYFVLFERVSPTEWLTVFAQRESLVGEWYVYSAFNFIPHLVYFGTFCDLEGNTLAVHRVVTTIKYTNSHWKLLLLLLE